MKRLVLAALVAFASPALANPLPDLAGNCLSCHGVDGKAQIPFVPIIHGQQPQYLHNALHAYRSGARDGGRAPVMQAIAKDLSDADIDALAAWFGDIGSIDHAAPLADLVAASAEGAATRLVYIDEEDGWQRVLDAEQNRDYFLMASRLESERFLTFCSIASMATVLNSLKIDRPIDPVRFPYPYFTQDNIFTLENQKVKSFEGVVTDGLTLAQIGLYLEHLKVEATPQFADEADIDMLRQTILTGLNDPNARVIVNYNRGILGQDGGGHVSPIGAYDAETDSMLVLDVAGYKYPPVWVPMSMLMTAMADVDTGSGRARGVVIVRDFE